MNKNQSNITTSGLSSQKAAFLLQNNGFNELPAAKKRSLLKIALQVIREPMFILLLACGFIYLLSGELTEALMLLGFVFVVVGITILQERKTERALESLRDLASPRALVIRDGQKQRIPGREVVIGDIILLSEGDRVAADAILLESTNLSADESLLTGESVPVRKSSGNLTDEFVRPGGDDLPFVYSGSLIVQGSAIAQVVAVGINTEIGKIGKALAVLSTESTPLQKQTGKIVRSFALFGLGLCLLVVVVYGFTRANWLDGFLAGLSLAMALLPEEFPMILTIFLALGAWRISKSRVLTRHIPAVETIGSVTALCVDKTGTLTMNKMTVSDLCVNDTILSVSAEAKQHPEQFHELLEYSILASPVDPFDPMEKAMHELGQRTLKQTEHLHEEWELIKAYPLSKNLLAMSHVWKSREGSKLVVASKGAPEAIAKLCKLDEVQTAEMLKNIDALSQKGRRVIAVAAAIHDNVKLPDLQHKFNFRFVGLIGLEDPVRPGVRESIRACYQAGVRTIMITGDYPGTASSIAQQIGLKNPGEIITGSDLEAMSDVELADRIKTVNIFARMVPEQKLKIIKALKLNKEVVAMTGDGVNDAPALKSAHIGVAMGGRGTDVARESASIVLLDDDFESIVKAIKLGRRIYGNLKKAMMYTFSVHIPIAGMALIPVILEWPMALFPIQIVFLELIIDPACSFVFEAEKPEKNIMQQPPRKLDDSLFSRQAFALSFVQGLIILAISFGIYRWAYLEHGAEIARALCYTSLVIGNLGLIMTSRSRYQSIISMLKVPNKALWWVTGGTVTLLVVILSLPFAQNLFRFGAVNFTDLVICIVAGLGGIVLMECIKIPIIRRLFYS